MGIPSGNGLSGKLTVYGAPERAAAMNFPESEQGEREIPESSKKRAGAAFAVPALRHRNLGIRSYSSRPSSSSMSSPKRASASFTGWGVLISTPAIFSREMGSVEQPPLRNSR